MTFRHVFLEFLKVGLYIEIRVCALSTDRPFLTDCFVQQVWMMDGSSKPAEEGQGHHTLSASDELDFSLPQPPVLGG